MSSLCAELNTANALAKDITETTTGGEDITGDGGVVKEKMTETTIADAEKHNFYKPKSDQVVSVFYKGYLHSDPTVVFDEQNTYSFRFSVDSGGVISGWNHAVKTMVVGESSKFTISSNYAYGSSGSEPEIAPNATIVFEITLVALDGITAAEANANPTPTSDNIDPVAERLAKVRLEREKAEMKRQNEKKISEEKRQAAKAKLAEKMSSKGKKGGKKKKK